MVNELSDHEMIIKKQVNNRLTFEVKDEVSQVWMSQDTLSVFFEVSRKDIIEGISHVLSTTSLDKHVDIRTVSYVVNAQHTPRSIQERQYSFDVICYLAFYLKSESAKAFCYWIITSQKRLIQWGHIIDLSRVKCSERRLNAVQKKLSKI